MESKTESTGTGGRGKTTQLPAKVWVEIQAAYESGDPVRGLAKKYGVNHATISNRAKREGWAAHGSVKKEAVEEAREKTKEKLADEYETAAAEINKKNLKEIASAKVIVMAALKRRWAKEQWAEREDERRLKKAREEKDFTEKALKEAAARDKTPFVPLDDPDPEPYDLGNADYKTVALSNELTNLIIAERKIAGLEDTPAIPKDTKSGFRDIEAIMAESSELAEREPEYLRQLADDIEKERAKVEKEESET